jgi:hypothetical protein
MCGRITQIVQLVMIAVGGCSCLKRNCRSCEGKNRKKKEKNSIGKSEDDERTFSADSSPDDI